MLIALPVQATDVEGGKEEKMAVVENVEERKKGQGIEELERKDGGSKEEKEVVVAVDPTVQTHTDAARASRLQTQRVVPPIQVVTQHGTGPPAVPVPVPVPASSTPPQVPSFLLLIFCFCNLRVK